MSGVGVDRFEALYRDSSDPWRYQSSPYEREKYAATLAALGPGRYERALEVGCSIGVFTVQLAARCERLVAMDFSPTAIAIAGERLAEEAVGNVDLHTGAFPDQVPPGRWDLVVCSELLYYLDRETLDRAIGWLDDRLGEGTALVVVSWRGPGRTEPLRGDEVHELLHERLGSFHDLDDRTSGYRLDRFRPQPPARRTARRGHDRMPPR